jgi:hypothetical protein
MKTISIMEERARRFPLLQRHLNFSMLPPTEEKVREEIVYLNKLLRDLSSELRQVKEELKEKEKQFSLLANYKYLLEEKIVGVTKIKKEGKPKTKKESRGEALVRQMEALTPQQREFLKTL